MENSIDKINSVKGYVNNNIITQEEYNLLETELKNISVLTGNIQINSETDYNGAKYRMKAMILPNSNFALIKNQLLKSYKFLNFAVNKPNIKTIFLIGQSQLCIENYLYFSNYTTFETINPKVLFPVDLMLYNQLKKNKDLKSKTFDVSTYSLLSLIEEDDQIIEKEHIISESIEDKEYTFDIHLAMLSYLFPQLKTKIQICPLWINLKNTNAISNLAGILGQYFTKEEYFFIFSTNLTHFGKLYDFTWDSKFLPILRDSPQMQKVISEKFDNKSQNNLLSIIKNEFKEMLKNEKKKEDILKLIHMLDKHLIDGIKNKSLSETEKLNNINFCKDIILTLVEIIKDYRGLYIETIGYEILQCKNLDEVKDLNFVSLGSLVIYEITK